MRSALAAVALCLALASALSAQAVARDGDEVANDIARQVMSPFCPGVTLHDCPSDAAVELRQQIAQWARAGWARERIVAHLESEYGATTIRAAPAAEGAGWLAWLLPAAAVVAAAAGGTLLARRWTKSDSGAPRGASVATPTAEERARLDAELAELRARS